METSRIRTPPSRRSPLPPSTPSFMIGRLVGEEFVAEPLEGAQPLAEFQRVIEAALESGD